MALQSICRSTGWSMATVFQAARAKGFFLHQPPARAHYCLPACQTKLWPRPTRCPSVFHETTPKNRGFHGKLSFFMILSKKAGFFTDQGAFQGVRA